MASPVVPPKPSSLSTLINTGSLVTESAFIKVDSSPKHEPLTEKKSSAQEEPRSPQKQRKRPPLPPKPNLSLDREQTPKVRPRDHAKLASSLKSQQNNRSQEPKPQVTPREKNGRVPPPKPRRCSSVSISTSDEEKLEKQIRNCRSPQGQGSANLEEVIALSKTFAEHLQTADHSHIASKQSLTAEHSHTTASKQSLTAEHSHTTASKQPLTVKHSHTTASKQPLTVKHSHTTASKQPLTPEHSHTTASKQPLTVKHSHTTASKQPLMPEHSHTTASKQLLMAELEQTTASKQTLMAELEHTTASKQPLTVKHSHTTASKQPLMAELEQTTASKQTLMAELEQTTASKQTLMAELEQTTASKQPLTVKHSHTTASKQPLMVELEHTTASKQPLTVKHSQTTATKQPLMAAEQEFEEEYDHPYLSGSSIEVQPSPHKYLKYLHKPALRQASHPVLTGDHPGHSSLDPVFVPQWDPKSKEVIQHYHELQAKRLPLFKSMTLTEIAKKYSRFFPLKIQITEGHYGTSCKYSVSTDDRFNIHFKKRMKEVVIQTYGDEYFIPLSSAIQFGLVYDPNDNKAEAIEGHRFRRVADLIRVDPLPKMVRVKSACSCSNGVFLEHDELLVVIKVKRRLFLGKHMLQVLSLLTMRKKLLPQEAIANFTTKPLCLKLNLPQLLDHVPKLFPSKAMMYLDKDEEGTGSVDEEELPPYMFSWPVTLKEVKKHKSLVATPEKSLQLIDIPLHGNITAVKADIVPPRSPEDIEELFTKTRVFLNQFDVTQVDIYGDFRTEVAYDTQNTLYKIVRGNLKTLGVEVITPKSIKRLQQNTKYHRALPTDDNGDLASDSDSFTSSDHEDHIYAHMPGNVDSDEDDYELLQNLQIRPLLSGAAADPDLLHNKSLTLNTNSPTLMPRRSTEGSYSGSGVFTFSHESQPQSRLNLPPPSAPLANRSLSLGQLPTAEPSAEELSNQDENRQYLKTLTIDQVSNDTRQFATPSLIPRSSRGRGAQRPGNEANTTHALAV